MQVLAAGIVSAVFVVSNVVKEKVEEAIDADHVADIEIAEQGHCKENGVNAEFSVFDQIFNSQCDQRQPHHGIDPHRVMLLDDTVTGKRVANRENDDGSWTAFG